MTYENGTVQDDPTQGNEHEIEITSTVRNELALDDTT